MKKLFNKKYILVIITLLLLIIYQYIFLTNSKNNYETSIDKRRNIKYDKRRKIMIEMYKDIIEVCDKNNIKLLLAFGTLLGKYRENNIICSDFDLDFFILKEDTLNFINNIDKLKNKYKIIHTKMFGLYDKCVIIDIKTGINADFFYLYNINNNFFRLINPLYAYYVYNEKSVLYPYNWIYPLKKEKFLGKEIYMQNKPEKFLDCFYGKNFMIRNNICNKDCTICRKR